MTPDLAVHLCMHNPRRVFAHPPSCTGLPTLLTCGLHRMHSPCTGSACTGHAQLANRADRIRGQFGGKFRTGPESGANLPDGRYVNTGTGWPDVRACPARAHLALAQGNVWPVPCAARQLTGWPPGAYPGAVNTAAVIVTIRGRDGKLYPADQEPAARVRSLVHHLRCFELLSLRQVQRELAARYGIRRSVGRIHAILAGWTCQRCGDD